MDSDANSDFFLSEEKFDFDVTLSPSSATGDDEDEVFVNGTSLLGPGDEGGLNGGRVSWSQLTGEQLEAVCQEAHRLAGQLQCSQLHSQDVKEEELVQSRDANTDESVPNTEDEKHEAVQNLEARTDNLVLNMEAEKEALIKNVEAEKEAFVQNTEAKLGLLCHASKILSPVKRETICVQDSPIKQLPPAIQKKLLRGTSAATSSSSHRPAAASSHIRASKPGSVNRAKTQPRSALQGKAALGSATVLPNKLFAPTSSSSAAKLRAEKTRLQPPRKVAGVLKKSPSSGPSSKAASCEDLLSDSASVASDISDSSLNASLLGRRTLAPPTKSVVARNPAAVKAAPPLQSRRVMDRKNTSSSSSSVSSFNSSLSTSPAKGKLNSSLNQSISASACPPPSSVGRPRRSTIHTAAEPPPSSAARRSLSTQARKLSESERNRVAMSTPLKKAEARPFTPTKRLLERSSSISASDGTQSGLKARTKPQALVPPTLNAGSRGTRHEDEISKVSRPKRLMSFGSMDSLPQKPCAGPLTPSFGSCQPLQVKPHRPSALPTPVRRRPSAIYSPMSTNTSQTVRPRVDSSPEPTTTSARKEHSFSPAPKHMKEEPNDVPDIQPFCLEEDKEELTTAPPPNNDQPSQLESEDVKVSPNNSEIHPGTDVMEPEIQEENNTKAQEVLLLDLPVPVLQPQEKLLIDLSNTPDLIRTTSKTCSAAQLIDLSSPLIKWSPEERRENNAPLINLSF